MLEMNKEELHQVWTMPGHGGLWMPSRERVMLLPWLHGAPLALNQEERCLLGEVRTSQAAVRGLSTKRGVKLYSVGETWAKQAEKGVDATMSTFSLEVEKSMA